MLIKQRNPSTGDTHRQVGGCRWAGGRKKGVVGSSDISADILTAALCAGFVLLVKGS